MNERVESNGIVGRILRHLLIHALAGAGILLVFSAILPKFLDYASEVSLTLAPITILMFDLSSSLMDWWYLIVPAAIVVDVALVAGLARIGKKARWLLSGYSFAMLLLVIGALVACVFAIVVPFTLIEAICDACLEGHVRIILDEDNKVILDGREIDESELNSELDNLGRAIPGFCIYRDREADIDRERRVLQILKRRNVPIEFYNNRNFLYRIISEDHRPSLD